MYKEHQICIGIDFGTKKIGLAIGNTITKQAAPLSIINTTNGQHFKELDVIIKKWCPHILVVGMPGSQTSTPLLNSIKDFIAALRNRYDIPIHTIDELLTSQIAKTIISYKKPNKKKNKLHAENIDDMAAALILQSWFNASNES